MSKISFVNGEFVEHADACVHIEDRGYQFSDGVYEVVYVKDHILIDWHAHCDRLQRSLDGLRIDYQVDESSFKGLVEQLLDRNGYSEASVYIQLTRGVAKRDHPFPKSKPEPSICIMVNSINFPSKQQYEQGVSAISYPDQRWKRRDLKTISLLPNTLAKQAAVEQAAQEAILIEDDKVVTEGSSTNFFIVDRHGTLKTHEANTRILGGITRMNVLAVAKQQGVAIQEQAFLLDEVFDATEAFITSTTKHILPVVKVDDRIIGSGQPGPVTQRLMRGYEAFVHQQLGK